MKQIQSIGSRLHWLESKAKRDKQAQQQKLFSIAMTWLMILMIGIGLGYGWRMIQTSDQTLNSAFINEQPYERIGE